MLTVARPVEVKAPRDVAGTFEPQIVRKRQRCLSRLLDAVCPVVLIDAIHVKIRDGAVANRPVCAALAVTAEGRREILA